MENFKLSPHGFKEIRKLQLTRTLPIMVVSVIAGLYITFSQPSFDDDSTILVAIPVSVVIVLVTIIFSFRRTLNRQKVLWDSYELSIGEDLLIRRQHNVPTIEIGKNEITEIAALKNGDIRVKTDQRHRMVLVSKHIENRDEVLEKLGRLSEIKPLTSNQRQWIPFVVVAEIVLMIALFTSTTPWIVFSTGTVLTVGLIWAFIEIRRNENIDRKTKRVAYFIFLVMFSIISKMLHIYGLLEP